MSFIQRNLSPNEVLVAVSSRHWTSNLSPFRWLLIAGIITGVLFFLKEERELSLSARELDQVLTMVWVAGGALFVLQFIVLIATGTQLAASNKKIFYRGGVFSTATIELMLRAVECVSVSQGLLGRLLNYGKIEFRSTGGMRIKKSIAAPHDFWKAIRAYIQ